MEGFVVRVMPDKKFGFIKDAEGNDYFFHSSDVSGDFGDYIGDKQKVKVTFEPTQSAKGLRASNVKRVDY